MGEATIEAPARSSGGPIMAARAGGSSATDCSMDAPPTANPLAAATGALKPGGRPALEKAAVAPSPAPEPKWGGGAGKDTLVLTGAADDARQQTDDTHSTSIQGCCRGSLHAWHSNAWRWCWTRLRLHF